MMRGGDGAGVLRPGEKPLDNPAPEDAIHPPTFLSNPVSFLLWNWFSPVLYKGWKKPLLTSDLPALPAELFTEKNHPLVEKEWRKQLQAAASKGDSSKDKAGQKAGEKGKDVWTLTREGKSATLLRRALLSRYKWRLLISIALQLAYNASSFSGPTLQSKIIIFLQTPSARQSSYEEKMAYVYAVLMFVVPIIGSILSVQSARVAIRTQITVRASLTAAIYRKAVRLSSKARQQTEVGKIVNLMSADVNSVMMFFYPSLPQLFASPPVFVAAITLLWFQIRWATFVGLAFMLLSTPACGIFIRKVTKLRGEMLKCTDQRVKLMNQLLTGIRVLKMYAWESAQEAAVQQARVAELGRLRSSIPARVGVSCTIFAAPTIASVIAFAVYGAVEPERFTIARVFSSISLFGLLKMPLAFFPIALIQAGSALISMRRISAFLALEERGEAVEKLENVGILVQGGQFYWAAPPAKKEDPNEPGLSGRARRKREKLEGKEKAAAGQKTEEQPPPARRWGARWGVRRQQGSTAAAEAQAPAEPRATVAQIELAVEELPPSRPAPAAPLSEEDREASRPALRIEDVDSAMDIRGPDGQPKSLKATAEDSTWWLRDVDLDLREGQLVCIVGRVGSGKSSLVSALLGEMERAGGSIAMGGRVAYVAQQAWIVNESLRNNVLMRRPLEPAKWAATVDACCLTADLQMLPAGEDTEIGEKGINLSGGQKQRVSVARAVYSGADVYVLDDPLSAVDVHVGRHIFDKCILGLLAGKLRVLVTNQLQYLPQANHIIYLEDGHIAAQGPYEALSRNEGFSRLLAEFHATSRETEEGAESEEELIEAADEHSSVGGSFRTRGSGKGGSFRKGSVSFRRKGSGKTEGPPGVLAQGGLITKEDQAIGSVSVNVYSSYIKRYGLHFAMLLVFLWSSEQSMRILTSWWLSQWTSAEARVQIARAADQPASSPRTRYLVGYLGFSVGYVFLTAMRSVTNLTAALRASRLIHNHSLAAIVRSPIAFFDTTPMGRILNRFSKDTDDMDFTTPDQFSTFGSCVMSLAASLIFICIIQPWLLVGVVPLMILYYFIQKFYRRSFIELQRIDAVARSPVYALFSETLTGTETIRAYGMQDELAAMSDRRMDCSHRAYFSVFMASQWLSLRLDLIGSMLVFGTACAAIANRANVSTSLAALSLSEVLEMTGYLKFAVQLIARVESSFNSVERLLSYIDLPAEAPAVIPGKDAPEDWPQKGVVEYRDVWMRYRPELDPVLKGVSFRVSAGESVGIVGRTGSGKSSLIVSLFRLTEPFRGTISLDGVDLLSLGLNDVRGRIAAIPQDPVLFSGTVRSNVDPYDRYMDADIWEALSLVALKDVVAELEGGLSARVAEGGDNFSVGQRQLLCVARALLRKPRVLVADEATASVDGETDALIQRTIRSAFASSTVLTIAHRLNTILDSSRVLVMDSGVVAEYDTVDALLTRPTGIFRGMVENANMQGGKIE